MRLLIATDQWSPDVVGGSARVAAETARLLAARGHEVRVLAPQMPGFPAVSSSGSLQLHRTLRRGLLPQTFTDVVETWRASPKGRDFRPDVLVAHQTTTAAGLLAARLGAPLALVFHASLPLEQRFERAYMSALERAANLALHPAFVLLERLAVRQAGAILVLSDFSRKVVVARHPAAADSIARVRGGVDGDTFRPDQDIVEARARRKIVPGRPFLLTVRRLEPRMGIDLLLHACRLLVDRGTPFVLGIAGAGSLDGPLRRLAADLGLGDHVVFFGRVEEDELRQLYAAADVFVLPTVAYEGFGMSTLEALASGTPVVGTPIGATPELLRPFDPELVARSLEPADLADAVARLLSTPDPHLAQRCVDYARGQFDWSIVIADWEDALERLANPGSVVDLADRTETPG